MCNLYSMTTTHQAMRQLFRVQSGINQLHLPGIFPDHQAPVIRRRKDGERELVSARWGMPTPPAFRKTPIDRGQTNIRNVQSPHWRSWLMPEFRCLVPATSFCEPTDAADPATGKKVLTWCRWRAHALWLPDDGAKCCRGASPLESNACDPNHGSGMRCVAFGRACR